MADALIRPRPRRLAAETARQRERRRRLEAAARRLERGEPSILGLALEAGYASHEAFTRAFKRQLGVAPASYRRGGRAEGLDGLTLRVSATDPQGVVGAGTRLRLLQRGCRVLGRYGGGRVARGVLVGWLSGARLRFRYVQLETGGAVHAGRSRCEIERGADGRVRLVEHFAWRTRPGGGTNVFEQVGDEVHGTRR